MRVREFFQLLRTLLQVVYIYITFMYNLLSRERTDVTSRVQHSNKTQLFIC